MFVQCRHQQCVVGKRKREIHLGHFAVGSLVLEFLDRPVRLGLRVAAEADSLRCTVSGVRVHEDKRMGTAFQRRARDKPRLEQRFFRLGLGAAIDQVQARSIAVQRAEESR